MMMKTMETFNRPNFKKAYIIANEVLVKSGFIDDFPFSSTKIVEELLGIQCMSYTRAVSKYGLTVRDFGSNDAFIVNHNRRMLLFYNDKNSVERIRFSVLHEIGHILFNHEFSNQEFTYGKQEVETNFFVGQLLMPDQLIKEFRRRGKQISEEFLVSTFGVSNGAANKKITTISNVGEYTRTEEERIFDDLILSKFMAFIDKITPQNVYTSDWFDQDYEDEKERDKWR